MNHSPEPWSTIHLDNHSAQIYAIGQKACDGLDFNIPDAERIVACVNHCKGIPTETLLTQPHPTQ